ncbi:60Kd inner membrane protein-domain-containing protein [Dimargaris cristalligena]|uniref:60Kd inner membrane protein-domain-containing protein n=1 Tax=Dimargaris cristalligena TaxID=215637 RepID=A0A4V1J4E9_9FUNG|nr:60Kd inner membrane protein-domain-containing protein [Dimargaris cristalligena]|eukprot:RKP35319.1 60Kd inner membrane protein-domain-containing protein [Dimargaris cristalligena]
MFSTTRLARDAASSTTATSAAVEALSTPALDPQAVVEAAIPTTLKFGELSSMGFCHFTPPGFFEALMEAISATSGMPMWGVIMTCTLLTRLVLFPFTARSQRVSTTLQNLKPETEAMMARLKEASSMGLRNEQQMIAFELSNLYTKNNCNPTQMIGLMAIQLPVFIGFFLALRSMAELPVPQLLNGGFSWITDLTVADPYYILPVISAVSTLTVLEISSQATGGAMTSPKVKWFMRSMTVGFVYFTSHFPAAVLLYWSTTNFLSIIQTLALRSAFFRKFFKIPKLIEHKMVKSRPSALQQMTEAYRKAKKGQ